MCISFIICFFGESCLLPELSLGLKTNRLLGVTRLGLRPQWGCFYRLVILDA